jgi:phage tail sheath protein FI
MPVNTTFPGVYVQEAPSGVRTIVGVATSVTAFVGAARLGPTDTPVRVRSVADYVRAFGPVLDAARPMGNVVGHFFANGGAEAIVVRVAGAGAADADAVLTRGAAPNVANVLTLHARGAGGWANVVGGSGLQAIVSYADTANPADLFRLTLRHSGRDPRSGEAVVITEEVFDNLSMAPAHPRYARTVVAGSELVTVDPAADPPSTDQATSTGANIGTGNVTLTAAQSRLRVSVDHGAPADLVVGPVNNSTKNALATAITAAATAAGLPITASATNTAFTLTTTGTGGANRSVVVSVAPENDASQVLGLGLAWGGTEVSGAASVRPDVATFAFTGGAEGTVGAGDVVPDSGSGGVFSLNVLEFPRFNLLCLPDVPASDPAVATTALRSQKLGVAMAYCREQRAMLIVDTPLGWRVAPNPQLGGLPALGEHAALYYPRLSVVEPGPDGLPRTVDLPPCGAVAGVMARTDATAGIWKAPAGLSAGIVGISGLSVPTDDGLSGVLNPRGVNVLRTFPGAGTVVWGARTLKGADTQASEFKYVPVRRLTDFIASSLYLGTQFAVFEPNDPDLWATLRLAVTTFMRGLFLAGAFQQSPTRAESDSFFVRCDESTNPQAEIDLGRVNVVVGFAPLKPAEFVIVTITQISQLEA